MANKLKEWARALKRDVHAIYLAARDPRVPWYAKANKPYGRYRDRTCLDSIHGAGRVARLSVFRERKLQPDEPPSADEFEEPRRSSLPPTGLEFGLL